MTPLPAALSLPGLRLRRPRPEDAPALFAWASDPEVTRYLSFAPHRDVDESRAALRRWARAWAESEGLLLPCRTLAYLIEVEGKPVGSLSVHWSRYGLELGYALARAQWGRGIAPRAVRGLAEWLLAHGAHRVYATAHVENAASHRVLEKAGFVREGRLSRYFFFPNLGAYGDGYLYARVE